MSSKRYTEEFKREAVKQVIDKGYPAIEVAKRLGLAKSTLSDWVKHYKLSDIDRLLKGDQEAELRHLRAELKRVTEERDILKKCTAYFAKTSQ